MARIRPGVRRFGDKDRFNEALSRKQEELEDYWRSRRSA
jgi:hypothetical protein